MHPVSLLRHDRNESGLAADIIRLPRGVADVPPPGLAIPAAGTVQPGRVRMGSQQHRGGMGSTSLGALLPSPQRTALGRDHE